MNKHKIMSKKKDSKEAGTKPELYTVLGFVNITRQHFIEIIEQIQEQNWKDLAYCEALGKVLHPHIEPYNNHLIENALFKLVQMAFKDDHAHSWLEYYCWELEFGKKYKDGCATRKDGTNINLSDAGKLYDYLNEA